MDRRRVELRFLACDTSVFPLDQQPVVPVIPDGLEPSLPGCRPGVVAAGPRDRAVTRGRLELPRPQWGRGSQPRVSAASTTWSSGRQDISPPGQVADSGVAPESWAYETLPDTRP